MIDDKVIELNPQPEISFAEQCYIDYAEILLHLKSCEAFGALDYNFVIMLSKTIMLLDDLITNLEKWHGDPCNILKDRGDEQ